MTAGDDGYKYALYNGVLVWPGRCRSCGYKGGRRIRLVGMQENSGKALYRCDRCNTTVARTRAQISRYVGRRP